MIETPDWVKHAVFYQVFPDRFARSPRLQHPRGIRFEPWGSPPTPHGFQGGDLLGVVDRLDYLEQLGVNALYLNPVFASASNHRYHTYDYYQVDPLLGGNEALRELLEEAHRRQMRVVLDGVFNHASRGFWAFHHILETGGKSPYLDWFRIRDWPLRPYHSNARRPANYDAWWNLPALPKFNVRNPGVRDYLLGVARHWIEFGIDGWRLDVPQEIRDARFWRSVRRVVKEADPEAYLCGEIWEEAPRWLAGDRFDGLMNYVFCWAALSFFGADSLRSGYRKRHLRLKPLRGAGFSRVVRRMASLYDWEATLAQLNLLGSHDMARPLWILGGDRSALRLAVLFQMTMPGAPCIYYGDEIGLSAGDDPHCRQAFPWHEPSSWDSGLLGFYRRAVALRRSHEVLRVGSFEELGRGRSWYAFRRRLGAREAAVVLNAGRGRIRLELPATFSRGFRTLWPAPEENGAGGPAGRSLGLEVPPRQARVLLAGGGRT